MLEELEEKQISLEKSLAELKNALERATLNSEIIGSISKIYWLIYRMDLIRGTYEEISAKDEMHRLTGRHGRDETDSRDGTERCEDDSDLCDDGKRLCGRYCEKQRGRYERAPVQAAERRKTAAGHPAVSDEENRINSLRQKQSAGIWKKHPYPGAFWHQKELRDEIIGLQAEKSPVFRRDPEAVVRHEVV